MKLLLILFFVLFITPSNSFTAMNDVRNYYGHHLPISPSQIQQRVPHSRLTGAKPKSYPPHSFNVQQIKSRTGIFSVDSDSGGIRTGWKKNFSSNQAATFDEAVDMATDSFGNVYVTGNSFNGESLYDIVTIKYDANGTMLWKAVYNDDYDNDDFAVKMKVDNLGNVYVGGSALNAAGNDNDVIVLKYAPNGNLVWLQRYDGGGRNYDWTISTETVRDMAFTSLGNLIVVANVWDTLPGVTAVVVFCYTPDGVELWRAKVIDSPIDVNNPILTIDRSDNVFVIVTLNNFDTYDNIKTIKYNTHGVEQWSVIFDGQNHLRDVAFSATADDSGNVYICGSSDYIADNQDNWDYEGKGLIIKYNAIGQQLWVRYHCEREYGQDIYFHSSIDHSGNICVVGLDMYLDLGEDSNKCIAIKYAPNGDSLWEMKKTVAGWWDAYYYDGFPYEPKMTIDADNNVIITDWMAGNDSSYDLNFMTVKYDAMGNEQWLRIYDGPSEHESPEYDNRLFNDIPMAQAIDGEGNIYISGMSYRDTTGENYVIVKYNNSGDSLWVQTYAGNNTVDVARSMATDKQGNTYIAGSENIVGNGDDFLFLKYNANGDLKWKRTYNGTGNGDDAVIALTVNNYSDVVLTGLSKGIDGGSDDIVTMKYSSEGTLQWIERYGYQPGSSDVPIGIGVDAQRNVYVGGIITTIDGTLLTVLKYTVGGALLWSKQYSTPPTDRNHREMNFVMDKSFNIYISSTQRDTLQHYGYFTVKINPNGEEQWARTYGDSSGSSIPKGLQTDKNNNVYVTGSSGGYITTLKYAPNGVLQWVAQDSSGYGTGLSVDVDNGGNIFVMCSFNLPATGLRGYNVIKYRGTGTKQWMANYTSSSASGEEKPRAMKVDKNGNSYVTGDGYGMYATVKFSPSGELLWSVSNAPTTNMIFDNTAIALTVDDSGRVTVTGNYGRYRVNYVYGILPEEFTSSIFTINYLPDGVTSVDTAIPTTFSLEQNYPNPFNPYTTIGYTLRNNGLVTLSVYNIIGQEVFTLINKKEIAAGKHEIVFDASQFSSGVYFYRLRVSTGGKEQFVETRKLLLVK